MNPTVTARCTECDGQIVVEIPAPVSEYATNVDCPNCGADNRVTAVRC